MTDKVCRYRKPYGKGLSKERGSIFVASVNTTDFLRDPTGNCRFWVIPTGLTEGGKLNLDLRAEIVTAFGRLAISPTGGAATDAQP